MVEDQDRRPTSRPRVGRPDGGGPATRLLCLLLALACASCKSPEEQEAEDVARLRQLQIDAEKQAEADRREADRRERDRMLEAEYDLQWARCISDMGPDRCRVIGEALLWRCALAGDDKALRSCAADRFERRAEILGAPLPDPEPEPEPDPATGPEAPPPAEDPAQ